MIWPLYRSKALQSVTMEFWAHKRSTEVWFNPCVRNKLRTQLVFQAAANAVGWTVVAACGPSFAKQPRRKNGAQSAPNLFRKKSGICDGFPPP